jgi:hypothetical protein
MNLVFVNSFEKRKEDGLFLHAQVSIAERNGNWQVVWTGAGEGDKPEREVWYEGGKWQDMLTAFRLHLAEKAADGYLPLIDGHSDDEWMAGKGGFIRMLQYYGEHHADPELYEKLRKWRRERSMREKKPSYLYATNRVLRMIACYVPKTMDELAQIPGFGEHKRNLYGRELLAITESHGRTTAFPLDWVPAKVDAHDFRLWLHRQRETRTRTLLERKEAKRRMLGLIAAGRPLADIAESLKLSRRETVLLAEELATEGHAFDGWLENALKDMPAAEREKAWAAMQADGGRYLKPVLQKTYGEEELKERDLEQLYEWLRLLRMLMRSRRRTPEREAPKEAV